MRTNATASSNRPRRRLPLLLATASALLVSGLAVPASAAAGEPETYLGHTYSSQVKPPSADKPQSKLWHHDGAWWALMLEAGGERVYVHELMPDHTWRNTGTLVDSRKDSTGDALWVADEGKLYVASRVSGANLQVNRFTYDAGGRSWSVDTGFPVTVETGGGSESASIDQDSTGRLWVTYTRGARVWVAYSDPGGQNWTAGFLPPVPDTTIKSDDLSAIVAFGSSIGVMWSDQESGAFRFAIHDDGAPLDQWRFETVPGPSSADDHINLKQLVGDPQGRVFAAVKTSAGDASTDPQDAALVGVLTRTPGADGVGSWAFAPAGTVADDHTRPLIMIDKTNQELYFFATAPVKGGDIFYKKAPLSDIAFGPGRGTPFIDTSAWLNNASGAKDAVTAETGLVILAVAHGKKQYVHGEMELTGGGDGGSGDGDTTAPTATTSPAAGATDVDVAANVTATFSEPVTGVDGGTFTLTAPDGSPVTGTVSHDGAGGVATLDPSADLAVGTQYTATLTGGPDAIRDAAGNPLATVSWTFTTVAASEPTDPAEPEEPTDPGDADAPTITWRSPAPDSTGAWLRQTVAVTFSEEVVGVDTGSFTLQNAATGAPVTVSVFPGTKANQWKLQPDARLDNLTEYTVTLTGGSDAIRDLAGNPLATVSWSFTTR